MSPIALTDAEGDSCRPLDAPTSSVFPHADADIKLRKLWVQHGDIQSPTLVPGSPQDMPRLMIVKLCKPRPYESWITRDIQC